MDDIIKEVCKDLPYDIYYIISGYFKCQCGAYDNLKDGLCSRCFPDKFVIDNYFRASMNLNEIWIEEDSVDVVGCIQSALIFNSNYYRQYPHSTLIRQMVVKFDVIDPLIQKLEEYFQVNVFMFDRYIYSVMVENNTSFDMDAFGNAVANYIMSYINLKLS